MEATEAKKGFLAIGIIVFLCAAITVVLAVAGWSWVNRSGLLSKINSGFSAPLMNMDRNDLETYLAGLHYDCEDENNRASGDYEFIFCNKKIDGETFSLGITYSLKDGKPMAMNMTVNKSENEKQKETVAAIFGELIRIPYKGSNPDAASAWLDQCLEFKDVDMLTISKSISGVTFTYMMHADQYFLSIGSQYEYD